ncbi:hypothetical protein [Caldimonas thermodepolymerans]|uniref:hypothetical protein n=1 Tax=Caldimonas thermodepolymerans TaxID=215580 RepID=UPI00223596BD|nr:hypothetical protein [Caldimonas thermodepolymerans]UZG45973.1 hypothetical protein ONZ46_08505 [Caldimonas thermodepolymerans]
MNAGRPLPPRHVPTLTEVVQPGPDQGAAPAAPAPQPQPALQAEPQPAVAPLLEGPPKPPAFLLAAEGEDALTQRVLADLQRQIDLMLEYRLRETLTPALARMADQLIRDTRVELAATLREVVARAVAQELARLRQR